jgi:hypothetical protein
MDNASATLDRPDLPPRLSSQQELEPIFELRGPAFRLMQRVGIIQGSGPSLGRRSIAFLIIAWVPLLGFASLEGHAIGPTPALVVPAGLRRLCSLLHRRPTDIRS